MSMQNIVRLTGGQRSLGIEWDIDKFLRSGRLLKCLPLICVIYRSVVVVLAGHVTSASEEGL